MTKLKPGPYVILTFMYAWVNAQLTFETYAAIVNGNQIRLNDFEDRVVLLNGIVFIVNSLKMRHVTCIELIDQNCQRCFTTFREKDVRYVLRAL